MESKFFHASHELKYFSIPPQLHYNDFGKCRERRFENFCESKLEQVQKMKNKGNECGGRCDELWLLPFHSFILK